MWVPSRPRLQTSPPSHGVPLVLYDGTCRFCTGWAAKLVRMAAGRVHTRPCDRTLLEGFPGITHDDCMRELKLIDPAGTVYGGAEAVVLALRLGRPVLGTLALVYYLPLVRWIADRSYAAFARNRYRLFGRGEDCDDTCAVHSGR